MYTSFFLNTLRGHQLYCNGQPLHFGALHGQVIELMAYLCHQPSSNLWLLQAALYPDATPRQVQSWLQLVNQGLIAAQSPVELTFGSNATVTLSQNLGWDMKEYLLLDCDSGFEQVYASLLGYRGPFLPASNSPWAVGMRERLRIQLLTVGEGVCGSINERVRMFALLEQKVPGAGAWLAQRKMATPELPFELFELFGLGG